MGEQKGNNNSIAENESDWLNPMIETPSEDKAEKPTPRKQMKNK